MPDVLKFHYFGQLLLDSNCLLLALKMFGFAEVSATVQTKHESEDFKYVDPLARTYTSASSVIAT